jgi:hypothetical protein
LGNESKSTNQLTEAMRKDPLGRAQKQLSELRKLWTKHGATAALIPLTPKGPEKPGRDWLPEPDWISGWDAFEIIRLQTEPYEWAPAIARICEVIADQWDREERGLNYALATLPPNHELLEDIPHGSFQWFHALRCLLKIDGAEGIEGWEGLVNDLYDWIGPYDCLRIRPAEFFENALSHHWSVRELSLPETKQEPIWSFPKAMAWIATRDYLALARMPVFTQPVNETEEAVATDGVWRYATKALGWLHSEIAYTHCHCGALRQFCWEAYKHCTCISIAWEELVHFNGGLSPQTPELVFNIQEGWLSMTWPEGADELRFLRRDILERWPALVPETVRAPKIEQSTTTGEQDCRQWLVSEFAADPKKQRPKKSFREAALQAFSGRLSERGFNLRVWPELAREHGRDSAGAKRKS